MTIALTGGTGIVGSALIEEGLAAGLALRALTRREQPPRAGVEWVRGDLANEAALARLAKGAEAVIHVAGLTNTPDPAEFETVNVTGTLNVIEAARAAGVPRFVLVSSLAAREPELSRYGASKARAEMLTKASGLDWTIVRPPGVYGPHDRDMLELFKGAKLGLVPMPREGRQSIIHAHDLARLLFAVVPASEAVSYRIFEPDDGKPGGWEHGELALAFGQAMGKRPWVPRLSRKTMERMARLDGWLRKDKARLTPDRVGYMCHPDWSSDPAAKVPPDVWKPQIETRRGLAEQARWYRDKGWL